MSYDQAPEYTENFAEVERTENEWILKRRAAAGGVKPEEPLVGLALSGGGIRSAAFNMGVLQALSRSGLMPRVDYLSTVSGGGYIGSCLSWLRAHVPVKSTQKLGAIPLADGNGTVLDWLRVHGRYLITGKGLSGWTLGASILSGTLLNLFVLVPLILLLIGLASGDWFEFAWPPQLKLPSAEAVQAHDGFFIVLVFGVCLFAIYLLTTLAFALSTVLPPLRQISANQFFRQRLGGLLAGAVICVAIGLLPALAGIEETVAAWVDAKGTREATRQATWIAPLLTGVATLYKSRKSGQHSDTYATAGLVLVLAGMFTVLYHVAHHTRLLESPLFIAWLAASVVLAFACDINAVSMHSYYRSRLAEAFMPKVSEGGDERLRNPLSFRLTDLHAESGAPFQIINTTLNTSSSTEPKLRARNGENMILTPLYCGSASTGYRRTSHWLRGELTLSTALAVSGAAVDPDTYATKSRPVSFLMTLLNVRLGIWVLNPHHEPRRLRWPAWYQLMLREMLGVGLSEKETRIHLADGGHFENLGLYELLRRRCRYMIVGDAGADPGTTLADLGEAVQRARADLGVQFDLCPDALIADPKATRTQAHLFGSVTYADGSHGEILYLKALMRQKLGVDVYGYWRTNPDFPNQPTSNQFYGELQFDSYRELGLQLMNGIIGGERDVESIFAQWRGPSPTA